MLFLVKSEPERAAGAAAQGEREREESACPRGLGRAPAVPARRQVRGGRAGLCGPGARWRRPAGGSGPPGTLGKVGRDPRRRRPEHLPPGALPREPAGGCVPGPETRSLSFLLGAGSRGARASPSPSRPTCPYSTSGDPLRGGKAPRKITRHVQGTRGRAGALPWAPGPSRVWSPRGPFPPRSPPRAGSEGEGAGDSPAEFTFEQLTCPGLPGGGLLGGP